MAALIIAAPAYAARCHGARQMPRSTDRTLVAILSDQVGRPISVAGSYREGRWSIYDVVADGDHGFVFFSGVPARAPKA